VTPNIAPGPMMQGSVTALIPVYSDGTVNPLSLDTAGRLRVLPYQGSGAVDSTNPLQVTLANTGANATAIKVNGSAVTQPISGSVTVTQATGTNLHAVLDSGTTTVTQATGTNLHTVVDSGTITAVTSITNALPAGTAILGKVGIDQTTPGTTNGVQVNAALPAGTNAIGKLAANSGVDIGDVDVTSVSGNVTVVQPTGTNLHVVVDTAPSTAVTNANLDVALSTLATAAAQTTGNSSLSTIAAKDFATETTLAKLTLAQGTSATSTTGPMVQAFVSDTIASFNPDTVQPLQLSTDGRLRVVTLDESYNFTSWGDLMSYGSDTGDEFPSSSAW
jgi:hypothetical protein